MEKNRNQIENFYFGFVYLNIENQNTKTKIPIFFGLVLVLVFQKPTYRKCQTENTKYYSTENTKPKITNN